MTAPARATLWTADELSRAGTPYERYELWDGVPIVKDPSGGPHGCIGARLLVRLALYVEARGLGSVWDSSAGFIVAGRPDRVLSPDIAFVARGRLLSPPAEGFIPLVPDFACEIRSPSDSWEAVVEKGGIWIAHGVSTIWLVNPPQRTVLALVPGQEPQAQGPGDVVAARPVLPRFRLRVDDLFAGFGGPAARP